MKKLYSTEEVSKIFGIPCHRLRRYVKEKKLESTRFCGGHHQFLPSQLRDFANKNSFPVILPSTDEMIV